MMNRPGTLEVSRCSFTAQSTSGTSCHSSISTGVRCPSRVERGSWRMAAAVSGFWQANTVRATCKAVVVLPTPRGPRSSTAPDLDRACSRWVSTNRGM